MIDILSYSCLIGAAGLLLTLSVIDLKTWLLPNPYVLAFAILGVVFHTLHEFYYLGPDEMVIGALAGGGILYAIRFLGNRYYGQDTLGLGDVKLLAAAGLWLGFDGVMAAITAGAIAGVLHGLGVAVWTSVKTKQRISVSNLMIPAGPGFAVGIVIAGIWFFQDLFV